MFNKKVTISFILYKENDQELIDWLNSQPNKSKAIREILTRSLAETIITQEEQYTRILDILEELQSREFTVVSNGNSPQVTEQVEETESPDISDSLDNLWR